MMAHPPARAQSLIGALAAHDRRDSVLGDLLEEYSETRVPEQGKAAANRWYVRQALGFLWTAAALPGALIAAVLTVRTALDALLPVPDLAGRAWVTMYVTMALFTFTGFRIGLVTRRISGAMVTALAATVIATIVAYAAVFALMALAIAVGDSGPVVWNGLREGLDIPAHVIAAIGVVLAALGAAAGRAFPKWPSPAQI